MHEGIRMTKHCEDIPHAPARIFIHTRLLQHGRLHDAGLTEMTLTRAPKGETTQHRVRSMQ